MNIGEIKASVIAIMCALLGYMNTFNSFKNRVLNIRSMVMINVNLPCLNIFTNVGKIKIVLTHYLEILAIMGLIALISSLVSILIKV